MKKFKLIPLFTSSLILFGCASNNSNVVDPNFDIEVANKNNIEIIFNAGEGIFTKSGLHAKSIQLMSGYTWKVVKASYAPTSNEIDCGESVFQKWVLPESEGGGDIPDNYTFQVTPEHPSKTFVLDAKYDVVERVNITLDLNGGSFKGSTDDIVFTPKKGEKWAQYYDTYEPYIEAAEDPTDPHVFECFKYNEQKVDSDFTFTGNMTLVASYTQLGTTNDFETDSWPIFISALNKGFAFISTRNEGPLDDGEGNLGGGYMNAFNSTEGGKAAGTFVGLTRTVRMYNSDYKVRVIGENIDTLASDASKKATLTFQFVDAVENNVGWHITDDNTYNTAMIRSYLNDLFINALPDDLNSSLLKVRKRTYIGHGAVGEESDVVNEYGETIFLLSFAEMGITEFTYSGGDVTCHTEGFGASNNEPYAYYEDLDKSKLVYQYYEDHNNPDTAQAVDYWTRSADDESTTSAWFISHNDVDHDYIPYDGSYSASYGLGIVPCFALGEVAE